MSLQQVADITRKLTNSRASTVDRNNATIGVGEAVEVMEAELKGKRGE